MPYIPFFSRLTLHEYEGFLIAIVVFVLERLLRIFLLVVPYHYIASYVPARLLKHFEAIVNRFPTDKPKDALDFFELVDIWQVSFPTCSALSATGDLPYSPEAVYSVACASPKM
ncbi:hypothetical protein EV182_006594 [Spiromyces aspiralis]|uniref:Uncharacterized protein n=1 Tax=Spiromyces aspiralis TaxID=68401 RepID=A0ACC1HL10_9FUNG|nr:hypothetical protein EV182_006594 [Spiromyces aspiralis]